MYFKFHGWGPNASTSLLPVGAVQSAASQVMKDKRGLSLAGAAETHGLTIVSSFPQPIRPPPLPVYVSLLLVTANQRPASALTHRLLLSQPMVLCKVLLH